MSTESLVITPAVLRAASEYSSQTSLAAAAGVGQQVVAAIEAGRSVRLESLRKVAQALGVSTERLVAAMEQCRRTGSEGTA